MSETGPGSEGRNNRSAFSGSGRVVDLGCVSDLTIAWFAAQELGLAGYQMDPEMAGDIDSHLRRMFVCGCKAEYRSFMASPRHVTSGEIRAGLLTQHSTFYGGPTYGVEG